MFSHQFASLFRHTAFAILVVANAATAASGEDNERTHPITESVLDAQSTGVLVKSSAAARKWLETIEDDQEIRDVFLDFQLQGRLTGAASLNAEVSANALRLSPSDRRDLIIRLLRVKCETHPVSEDDLDVLFKLYWRGLKAELKQAPRTSASPEQGEAAKTVLLSEIFRYLADHPMELSRLTRSYADDSKVSISDSACLVSRMIEAASSRLDVDTVDTYMISLLNSEKSTPEGPLRFESDEWQAFLEKHYSSEAMPAQIRSQLARYGNPLPFRKFHLRTAVTWTTSGKSRTSLVEETCHAQEGTLVRCAGDYFVEGIERRYMTRVYFGAPIPWIYKSQDDIDGLPTQPPVFMALAAGDKLPQSISPDSEFAFRRVQWAKGSEVTRQHQSVICRSGARYAANQLHSDLPGTAIDLDCTITENGEFAESQTLAYLETPGVAIYRKGTTSDWSTAASTLSFSMEGIGPPTE